MEPAAAALQIASLVILQDFLQSTASMVQPIAKFLIGMDKIFTWPIATMPPAVPAQPHFWTEVQVAV